MPFIHSRPSGSTLAAANQSAAVAPCRTHCHPAPRALSRLQLWRAADHETASPVHADSPTSLSRGPRPAHRRPPNPFSFPTGPPPRHAKTITKTKDRSTPPPHAIPKLPGKIPGFITQLPIAKPRTEGGHRADAAIQSARRHCVVCASPHPPSPSVPRPFLPLPSSVAVSRELRHLLPREVR